MFSVHCPRHGTEVLLGPNRIRGIEPVDGRLTVRWECYCGHHGAHDARSPARPPEQPAAPAPDPVPLPVPVRAACGA